MTYQEELIGKTEDQMMDVYDRYQPESTRLEADEYAYQFNQWVKSQGIILCRW